MTTSELQTERRYRIQERLGISCGANNPTPQDEMLAKLTVTDDMRKIEKLAEFDKVVTNWNKKD